MAQELPPIDPMDRVYYSGNPAFAHGGDERPDIEALLDPEIAGALHYLAESRDVNPTVLVNAKYPGLEAGKQVLGGLSKLTHYLDPERSEFLAAQTITVVDWLAAKVVKEDRQLSYRESQENIKKEIGAKSEGAALGLSLYVASVHGKETGQILVKLASIYADRPSVLPEIMHGFNTLSASIETTANDSEATGPSKEQNLAAARSAFKQAVEALASKPFPLLTASDDEIKKAFGNVGFEVDLKEENPLTQANVPVTDEKAEIFQRQYPGPSDVGSTLLVHQLVTTLAGAQSPQAASELMNRVFKIAINNQFDKGAQNLLNAIDYIFIAKTPEDIAKKLDEYKIPYDPTTYQPENFYRFIYLLELDREQKIGHEYDVFSAAENIHFVLTGYKAFSEHALPAILIRSDEKHGTDYIRQLRATPRYGEISPSKHPEIWPEHVARLSFSYWDRKARELIFERNDQNYAVTLYTPLDAFSLDLFRDRHPDLDAFETARKDFIDAAKYAPEMEGDLSHPGYIETITRLLELDQQNTDFAEIQKAIEELKAEIFVNGEYFVSPRGDKYIIDDPDLFEKGLRSITYSKMEDRQYTRVVIDFFGNEISCVITPDLELQTEDGKQLNLAEDLTEPLQYLIFGYFHSLRCREEREVEPNGHSEATQDQPLDSFVRRAHLRRLNPGENPHPRQIQLSLDHEHFDLVADNRWRRTQGLPKRTYVQETIIHPQGLPPNKLRDRSVTQRLIELSVKK